MALIAEGVWTSYDILNPRPAQGFGSIVDAGSVSDYATEGTVQYFLSGRFYVTQYQGGLRALYQKCPHLGCRVPFCQSSGRFECPCHGSVYNLIGEYVSGPAPRGWTGSRSRSAQTAGSRWIRRPSSRGRPRVS